MGIVYCYTNKINGKKYIGQTINPESRKSSHKSSAYNEKAPDFSTPFHRAIRKYGWENFEYEVLAKDISDKKILSYLEKYYISTLNTFSSNGYNLTSGGEYYKKTPVSDFSKKKMSLSKGELAEETVLALRKAYFDGESPTEIYHKNFENIMTYSAFMNIWSGRRYSQIGKDFLQKGRHTKLTEQIVKEIKKERLLHNTSYSSLAKKFNISKGTIADILKERTWKHATIESVSTIPESGK